MTHPLQLKLSTMTRLNTIIASQSVCVLQVWSLYQGICLQLPKAYAYDFIPLDVSCMSCSGHILNILQTKWQCSRIVMWARCLSPTASCFGQRELPIRTENIAGMEYNRSCRSSSSQTRWSKIRAQSHR